MSATSRERFVAVAVAGAPVALVLLKCAVGAAVLAFGFTHVSDDDYARVTIAQRFLASPALDPSGTSWLPLPFWLAGGAMFLTGPSLAAARMVAFVLGALSPLPAYVMLRSAGILRGAAFAAVAVAMASPWSAWSAATTVPDAWTGALIAAAAFALMSPKLLPWAALFAGAAAFSRYEAWPVCAVVAARATFGQMDTTPIALRPRRRFLLATAALAAPVAWILWNRHAHGDAFHFLARVTKFRAANGAASAPLVTKLFEYPRALAEDAPETVLFALVGCASVVLAKRARSAWIWPLLTALASVAFLVYGDLRDGAPTHHPARALIGVCWILTAWGFHHLFLLTARAPRPRSPAIVVLAAAAIASYVLFVSRYREPPGTGDADRSAAIARGLLLRGTPSLDVSPCAYEHFALLAAYEHPERAVIEPMVPRAPDDEADTCPRVVARNAELP